MQTLLLNAVKYNDSEDLVGYLLVLLDPSTNDIYVHRTFVADMYRKMFAKTCGGPQWKQDCMDKSLLVSALAKKFLPDLEITMASWLQLFSSVSSSADTQAVHQRVCTGPTVDADDDMVLLHVHYPGFAFAYNATFSIHKLQAAYVAPIEPALLESLSPSPSPSPSPSSSSSAAPAPAPLPSVPWDGLLEGCEGAPVTGLRAHMRVCALTYTEPLR
jgi:hypothetical protein